MPAPRSSSSLNVVRPQTATTSRAGGPREPGHAQGGLAVQGLRVQGTLADHDQVGAPNLLVEAEQLQHEVDPRPQGRAEDGDGGVPDTARGPGPRVVTVVRAEVSRDAVGEPGQVRVEGGDVRARSPPSAGRRPRPRPIVP